MEGRLPSMRDVHSFAIVAQAGSLHAAAQRLNVTVSAVSHRIRALEEEIGVALFERQGRGIRLTSAGISYRQSVLPLLDGFAIATAAAQRAGDDMLLRIAAFQTFHSHWLARRLNGFLALFPGAQVELLSLRSRQTRPDLTVRISRPGEVGAQEELLAPFDIGPVCHPALIEGRQDLCPEDVLDLPLIIPNVSNELWPDWAAHAGLAWRQPRTAIVVDSLPLSVELAAAGQGVALLAGTFDAHGAALGLRRPFPALNATMGWLHVNRAAGRERPVVEAFRAWLEEEFAKSRSGMKRAATSG